MFKQYWDYLFANACLVISGTALLIGPVYPWAIAPTAFLFWASFVMKTSRLRLPHVRGWHRVTDSLVTLAVYAPLLAVGIYALTGCPHAPQLTGSVLLLYGLIGFAANGEQMWRQARS